MPPPSPPPITHLTSLTTHATFSSQASKTGNPTVIYLSSSSLPACKTFTPLYKTLASSPTYSDITFAQIEYTEDTSMLFKFSPNQLPVLVFMCRDKEGMPWAKTVMGASTRELDKGVEEMMERRGGGKLGGSE